MDDKNPFFVVAALSTFVAALLHLGCIVFGGPWYRFLGAGEQMAQMADEGHWYPTAITLIISAILVVWAFYALSGAGVISRLPLIRLALLLIAAVFIIRGLSAPLIAPYFPGNSIALWVTSSVICLVIGGLYAVGLYQTWSKLGVQNA